MQSLKPSPSFPEAILDGHADVLEDDLRGVGGADAELVLLLSDADPRRLAIYHEPHDALVLEFLVCRGENRVIVGDTAVRDELLGAVEDVRIAVKLCRHGERRGVRSRARLGEAEGPQAALVQDVEETPLLVVVAADDDRICAEHTTGQYRRSDTGVSSCKLFADHGLADEVDPGPAEFLGHADGEKPDLVQFLYDFPGELIPLVVVDGMGGDLLIGKFPRHVLDGFLFLVQMKTQHRTSS